MPLSSTYKYTYHFYFSPSGTYRIHIDKEQDTAPSRNAWSLFGKCFIRIIRLSRVLLAWNSPHHSMNSAIFSVIAFMDFLVLMVDEVLHALNETVRCQNGSNHSIRYCFWVQKTWHISTCWLSVIKGPLSIAWLSHFLCQIRSCHVNTLGDR